MNAASNVRICLVTLGLALGCYGLASATAELNTVPRPAFPADPAKIAPPAGDVPGWLQAIPLFRSDLESNHALMAALQTVQRAKPGGGASPDNVRARSRVRQALSSAPYDADLWLALALLESQHDPSGPAMLEALKMTYFTAPNDTRLMPVRLDTATQFDALVDPDLAELARGDIRLMLTRRADLKPAVVLAYRRASKQGKEFLEQAVKAIEPSFVATLRG
ncbi:hypothetical protein [Bradyrhizobium sp. BR 10289]|uniref:hypothetical protein n=1 Tax=Bradyrhizobium sp. BR 10289 TaxID=2749993 RepID=UPI001C654930|nr:hypothetical protein [Bradyrhizobium sp. BR 10289]MBW7971541.1 hypothetical protein [Bradyrhizobium sp. BR 10289]